MSDRRRTPAGVNLINGIRDLHFREKACMCQGLTGRWGYHSLGCFKDVCRESLHWSLMEAGAGGSTVTPGVQMWRKGMHLFWTIHCDSRAEEAFWRKRKCLSRQTTGIYGFQGAVFALQPVNAVLIKHKIKINLKSDWYICFQRTHWIILTTH